MPIEHDHRADTWNLAPDALVLVGPDGVILDANDQAIELFVLPDLIGRSVDSLVPDEVTDHTALRNGYVDAPERRAMGAGARLQAKRGDGSVLPVHIALSPLGGGLTLAAVRDQREVEHVEQRMIDATRRRILAEEHERIARDLHDRIIQSLFALGMDLEAGLAIPETDQSDRISRAVDTLDDVIRAIRDVIFDVRRNRPDHESVRGQVVALATDLIPSLGFEPALKFNGELDQLDPTLADHVVAVVRESLANVARHADASAATVTLNGGASEVKIRIIDDGVGMPDQPDRRSGHGNLADRARIAQGSFRVGTRPEGGTIVEWTAPTGGA
jgi:PAS domain S-box-containing protein